MRKKGSNSEFSERRDRELHARFMEILRRSKGVALRDMFGLAARCESSRFWVSEERASEVVGAMRRGSRDELLGAMNQKKREMYEEIAARVERELEVSPHLPLVKAVARVVEERAPEFYLTDESARTLIYAYSRKIKSANKKKL